MSRPASGDDGSRSILVRSYRPSDLAQARLLDAKVEPYREEDREVVEAMFARAKTARQACDRWIPRSKSPHLPLNTALDRHLAFWVATKSSMSGVDEVVGMAGVHQVEEQPALSTEYSLQLDFVQDWLGRGDIVVLDHVRVAPEYHRKGIGLRLCQAGIEWSRGNGFGAMAVNTTSPQTPALKLYRKLGFREFARTFLDKYELVWLELEL